MSYLLFERESDLLWRTRDTGQSNTSEVDKRFLESLYPNAKVYLKKTFRTSTRDYYYIYIEFKTGADEAEFILRESI